MLWAQQNHKIYIFSMGDIALWFPKGKKEHIGKNLKQWFGPYKVQYCLPNNIVLLININKLKPNPILVNINKLKPYQYLGQAPKKLEATIKRGWEHKEDSREDVLDQADLENKEDSRSIEKITVNQKHPVVNIKEPIYRYIELERSFDLTKFDIDKLKN